MSRPLIDSELIFGIHEPGGEQTMLNAGRPGWVVFSEAIGHDPEDKTGIDFTKFSQRGLGIICRLNNGYEPNGTIPHSSQYEPFARRVANFVATSQGCKIWVIGNEMNYAVERPGIQIDWSRHASVHGDTPEESDPMRRGLAVRFNVLPDHSTEIRTTRGAIVSAGEVITPELYARCYRLCRDAIHRLPGHEEDQVLVGAVAPWNSQTIYPDNPNGDWVQYFRNILESLGPNNCDGLALHAYTHGSDPELIAAEEKLPPPFQNYHREFRAYRDFMAAIPASMRYLAVYITETDQTVPWIDANTGWVDQAYAEIDTWNRQPDSQPIRSLVLYRWPRMDRWHIDGKRGVIEDFEAALQHDYRWQPVEVSAVLETPPPTRAQLKENAKRAKTPVYGVQWVDDRFPQKLLAGQTITVPITIKNTGTLAWRWGGEQPFRVGYRYYRNRRLLSLGIEKDIRTDVPKDVEPDASVTVHVRLALPDQPGNYTLELDLVHEGVSWFKERGASVLTRWLTVEAPWDEPKEDGDGSGNNLPVPLFADVSTVLPRAGTPYARRSLNQVRYIVISHTGANPRLSLERIAETHVQYGYPGIAYDFVVDGSGQVYKVSNLEDVAQPDQIWSEQGVNICLAGNFSVETPPLPQLDATGRLCAWLAQNLGLAPESIVGLGELAKTNSPGKSFYSGVSWKSVLARQVRLHLAALSGSGDTSRTQELTTKLEEIRAKQRELQNQFDHIKRERDRLDAANTGLQVEVTDLQQQLDAQATEVVGGIRIHNWVEKLPRDKARYTSRRAQDIRYLVINHTGVAPDVTLQEIAAAHRPDWPGILYDYYVDVKGEVYQTQPLDEVVETDEVYLVSAINIAFAGDFNQHVPNNEQLYAGGKLIAWLLERYPQLRTEHIKGVSEFIEHTSPGEQWLDGQVWKEMLLAAVRRTRGTVEPSGVENQLRAHAAELEQQVNTLQHNNQSLLDQKLRLQSDSQKLQAQLSERQQEAKVYVVPQPAIRVVVDQLPKHPTLRYERRGLSQISHIAIHHTATPPTMGPARIAELHVAADTSRGKRRGRASAITILCT